MRSLWLWPLAAMALPAWADESKLAECQRINERVARYACYDTLPLPAGVVRVAPAKPEAATAEDFGLESKKLAAAVAQGPEALVSSITGHFEGWEANTRLKLANGQVWQIADGSTAYFPRENPAVTITRGVLGTFFLKVDGLNRQPKVKRVQ